MKINYDKIKGKLYIDNNVFDFNIESEMILKELHKEEKFKFMKAEKEILDLRQGLIMSLLNSDISILKFVLYASQGNELKLDISDFDKYYIDLIKNNAVQIAELFANAYMMFGGYIEFLGFPQIVERGLMIMKQKLEAEMCRTILTSKSYIAYTAKSELTELLKNSAN